jgi:hypothetical protein
LVSLNAICSVCRNNSDIPNVATTTTGLKTNHIIDEKSSLLIGNHVSDEGIFPHQPWIPSHHHPPNFIKINKGENAITIHKSNTLITKAAQKPIKGIKSSMPTTALSKN